MEPSPTEAAGIKHMLGLALVCGRIHQNIVISHFEDGRTGSFVRKLPETRKRLSSTDLPMRTRADGTRTTTAESSSYRMELPVSSPICEYRRSASCGPEEPASAHDNSCTPCHSESTCSQ